MANIFGTLNPKGATSSGGGGLTISTITILASQQDTAVLPDIKYDLTQEQIDVFNDNNVVEVILPDGTDYLYQANITSDTTQWGIKVFSKVIVGTDATGDYAYSKSLVFITNNITINETTMRSGGGGKQLYQHNITLIKTNKTYMTCQIISSDNTAFTLATLRNYLANNGFDYDTKYLMANGMFQKTVGANDVIYSITGLAIYNNELYIKGIKNDSTGTSIYEGYINTPSYDTFTDTVIAL